jgi:uncharacterized protein
MGIARTAAALLVAAFGLWPRDAPAGTVEDDFRAGLSAFNVGDYATALELWRPLAEQQDPRSEAGLGFMYHRGLGLQIDDAKAALWLTRAAEHGQPEGQLMLGLLYYYGRGVPQSYVRSYAWCELAESDGDAEATPCREAALEAMSDADRKEAFRLVVDLQQRYGAHR